MKRTITFEELPAPDIELDLDYMYRFQRGKYYGPPESCYPDDEDMEITLPSGWEDTVMNAYMLAARDAMKSIESKVLDMEFDCLPRQWWAEDAADCYDYRENDR